MKHFKIYINWSKFFFRKIQVNTVGFVQYLYVLCTDVKKKCLRFVETVKEFAHLKAIHTF